MALMRLKLSYFISLFHINVCSVKNFDDLDHLLKCTNKVFGITAGNETRIANETSLTISVNLKNYSFEFIPTESSADSKSLIL